MSNSGHKFNEKIHKSTSGLTITLTLTFEYARKLKKIYFAPV